MGSFNYQWSNLVIMIFKQVVIVVLVVMVFMVSPNPLRETIHPFFLIPGAIEPRKNSPV
jgi:uncharacterized membrane protein